LYNQMVLHHINDIEAIIKKFHSLLNFDGYLAIADLYPEDGSFHGFEVKVHRGFNPENLSDILRKTGFKNIKYSMCFEIKRETGTKYPVFLLVAQKLIDQKE
jgi:tRNA (cmo5U34)-methyltransferase